MLPPTPCSANWYLPPISGARDKGCARGSRCMAAQFSNSARPLAAARSPAASALRSRVSSAFSMSSRRKAERRPPLAIAAPPSSPYRAVKNASANPARNCSKLSAPTDSGAIVAVPFPQTPDDLPLGFVPPDIHGKNFQLREQDIPKQYRGVHVDIPLPHLDFLDRDRRAGPDEFLHPLHPVVGREEEPDRHALPAGTVVRRHQEALDRIEAEREIRGTANILPRGCRGRRIENEIPAEGRFGPVSSLP